jgi:hypothetical protein
MTRARRRQATPVSQGPTATAPDVPVAADPSPVPSAETKDDTQLLDPEGEPTQAGGGDTEARVAQARRRPGGLYPLPVWPD